MNKNKCFISGALLSYDVCSIAKLDMENSIYLGYGTTAISAKNTGEFDTVLSPLNTMSGYLYVDKAPEGEDEAYIEDFKKLRPLSSFILPDISTLDELLKDNVDSSAPMVTSLERLMDAVELVEAVASFKTNALIMEKCPATVADKCNSMSDFLRDELVKFRESSFIEDGKKIQKEKQCHVQLLYKRLLVLKDLGGDHFNIYNVLYRRIKGLMGTLDKRLETLTNKLYKPQEFKKQLMEVLGKKITLTKISEKFAQFTVSTSSPINSKNEYLNIHYLEVGDSKGNISHHHVCGIEICTPVDN